MTEYVCDTIICEKGSNVNDLLRAPKESLVSGVKSVRGKIAEGTKAAGKKWVKTANYKVGDLVGLEQVVYIAKRDSQGEDPRIYRDVWTVVLLPYQVNKGKVKAYVEFQADGTIIDSFNIDSVSWGFEYGSGIKQLSSYEIITTQYLTPATLAMCSLYHTDLPIKTVNYMNTSTGGTPLYTAANKFRGKISEVNYVGGKYNFEAVDLPDDTDSMIIMLFSSDNNYPTYPEI